MTKPLLLIVDDDRSLLDALEAELEPTFGTACRIETFDHPLDVLEALPRWQAERKPIALAIVDQKMPGITGVELIHRFRGSAREAMEDSLVLPTVEPQTTRFHPASAARTVLLTGYGGPEVALAARTQAGADRYREKPWNGRQLAADVRALLSEFWSQAAQGPSEILRECVTAEEMRRLWGELELLPQPHLEERSTQATGPRAGEEPPDDVVRLLRAAALSRGADSVTPELEEALFAFVQGTASAKQQHQVRAGLLTSPALRATFVQWLQDLEFLSSTSAREAFERMIVPDFVRRIVGGSGAA